MPSTQTPDVATLPLPKKERYTYANYATLPENGSYELIAGSLIMAPPTTLRHQHVLRRLAWAIQRYLDQSAISSR